MFLITTSKEQEADDPDTLQHSVAVFWDLATPTFRQLTIILLCNFLMRNDINSLAIYFLLHRFPVEGPPNDFYHSSFSVLCCCNLFVCLSWVLTLELLTWNYVAHAGFTHAVIVLSCLLDMSYKGFLFWNCK